MVVEKYFIDSLQVCTKELFLFIAFLRLTCRPLILTQKRKVVAFCDVNRSCNNLIYIYGLKLSQSPSPIP